MPPEHYGTDRKPSTPWLTAPEAAEYARTSRERIYEAIANGELKAVKPRADKRGRWLTRAEYLDAWLSARVVSAAPIRRGRRGAA
jgi:excisionase family DNA binding protein